MYISLLILILLGCALFFWIERIDRELDHPPLITVPAQYPAVYDAVIKALRTFSYRDYSWFISYPDPDGGHIQAKCRFREEVTSILRSEVRAIDLNVYLAETESGLTQLSYSFCVTSPYGRVEAAEIIQRTEGAIEHELNLVVSCDPALTPSCEPKTSSS